MQRLTQSIFYFIFKDICTLSVYVPSQGSAIKLDVTGSVINSNADLTVLIA